MSVQVYILTMLAFDDHGAINARNVGVTCCLHRAELHRSKGIEFDFESFEAEKELQEQCATTDVVIAMRQFCELVAEMQQEALR